MTGEAPQSASPPAPTDVQRLELTPLALPETTSPASIDHIFCDRERGRVWVPVGATGTVSVLDVATRRFSKIEGFKTTEREIRGKKRTVGPNAVAIGDGFAFIGNRASREVCSVDVQTLQISSCLTLDTPTDGVVYVAPTREVWVTTGEQAIVVLDAARPSALVAKTKMRFDGVPESYVVDASRGVAYTNLEDKGRTAVIDLQTHGLRSTWNLNCGEGGLRGLALDVGRNMLFVACPDRVQAVDAGHDGALLGRLDAGQGVDTIDYDEARHTLFVAAAKSSTFTVAQVDERGQFRATARGATAEGARNAVVDASGTAYLADSQRARLLTFSTRSAAAQAQR